MRDGLLPAFVAVEWFLGRERENVAERDLRLAPFEDERSMRLEDSEAFRESTRQHRFPVAIQAPVFLRHRAEFRVADDVRRIEHNMPEGGIRERERGEVCHHIGAHLNYRPAWIGAIRFDFVVLVSAIHERHALIILVQPHHAGAAARIQHWRQSRTSAWSQRRGRRFCIRGCCGGVAHAIRSAHSWRRCIHEPAALHHRAGPSVRCQA